MKKSISAIIAGLVFSVLMMSCASNNITLPEQSPMAIVSVSSNFSVPYDEEREEDYQDLDGIITKGLSTMAGKNNPEVYAAKDRADLGGERFTYLMQENAGVEFIPKETVIESETYSKILQGLLALSETKIRATDYKSVDEFGAKKARLFMSEIGAKSLVFLDYTFNKVVADGTKLNGKLAAQVTLTVSIYNERGKLVLNDTFKAQSSDTVEIYKLGYDKDELVALFPDVIDQVINKFIVKYM